MPFYHHSMCLKTSFYILKSYFVNLTGHLAVLYRNKRDSSQKVIHDMSSTRF
jgi:hypothetical protein